MCGIGLIVTSSTDICDAHNSNGGDITVHNQQMVLQKRLQKNISFRGPDLPFSKKEYVYEYVYTNGDCLDADENCCNDYRRNRGNECKSQNESNSLSATLNFYASVLHMQGATMVPQPLESSPPHPCLSSSISGTDDYDGGTQEDNNERNSPTSCNEEKYTFCWNGEAYCIDDDTNTHSLNRGKTCSDGSNVSPWYDIVASEQGSRSDTEIVLDYIVSNVFDEQKGIDRSSTTNGHQSQEQQHRRQKKMEDMHTEFSNIMSNIHGEYSFILYHHKQGCIYFGRDPLGRRSLLMRKAENINCADRDEASVYLSKKEKFIVSSVALKSELQSPDDDNESMIHEDAILSNIVMEEIPSGRVYCLDIKSGLLSYKHIQPKKISDCRNTIISPQMVSETDPITTEIEAMSIEQASEKLHQYLDNAIRRRVIHAPVPQSHITSTPTTDCSEEASVAVLFSGGVDSVVLAALCHHHVPERQPIDLINVAFANTSSNSHAAFESSPDRQAALLSYQEMISLWPSRKWRFIAVNVDYSEVLKHEKTICALIAPLSSTMDFNIGTAFWFASRGYGLDMNMQSSSDRGDMTGMIKKIKKSKDLRFSDTKTKTKVKLQCSMKKCEKISQDDCIFGACKFCCGCYQRPINQYLGGRASLCHIHNVKKSTKNCKSKGTQNDNKDSSKEVSNNSRTIHSNAKVILIGIGADEQMAGYGRHRTTFNKGGYDALRKELAMEKDRLWTRNLGRDDRCISHHGKEARFPFLDEAVVDFLNSLDVEQLCDMTRPPGEGDKMILRLIAKKIGINQCSGLVKRAIQFGSRIAKVSDTHRFGSSNKASGTATHR